MFHPAIRTIAFRGAALLLATGALGGATGIANADTTAPTTTVTATSTGKVHPHLAANSALVALHKQLRRDERQALLKALNLTPQQLRQDRRAGKSIAAIAQGENVPLTTVSTAMTTAAQTDLNQAVTAGTLQPRREQRMVGRLQTHFSKRLNATPGPHVGKHVRATASETHSAVGTTAS